MSNPGAAHKPRLPRSKRLLAQAITYFLFGVGNILFVMFFLAPLADAERHKRAAPATGSDGSAVVALAGSDEASGATTPDSTTGSADAAEPATGSADDTTPEPATGSAAVTPEPVTPEPVTPEPVKPEPVTPEPVTPEPVKPIPAAISIRFLIASATIPQGGYGQLGQVAKALMRDKTLHIDITGHTDLRGNTNENLALSDLRAKAAAKALEGMGIPESRMTPKGMGSTQPVDATDSPAAFAKNRRVDIVFVREGTP